MKTVKKIEVTRPVLPTRKKVAAYARVSTDSDEQLVSLDAQKTYYEKLIRSKKVMQVLDHCDIYFLIAGTYTPIALTGLRETHPGLAWSTFGIMWGVCLIGTVFTAIDLHKFGPLSYACYFIAGWSALISLYAIGRTYGTLFVLFLLAGGIAYTSGMVFFVRQTKGYRYSHSIFHLFILAGSVLHAIPIILWCM